MVKAQIVQPALLLVATQSFRLGRVDGLLDVGNVFTLGRDFPPSFQVRPEIRKLESNAVEPSSTELLIQARLDDGGRPACSGTGIDEGVLGGFAQASELLDENLGGLERCRSLVRRRRFPGAGKRSVRVCSKEFGTPRLVLDLCKVQPGEENALHCDEMPKRWKMNVDVLTIVYQVDEGGRTSSSAIEQLCHGTPALRIASPACRDPKHSSTYI